uniref:Uncharacterized protein n=1 Tax=Babesia bovis TaxID=5865 RepID=S6C9Q4_BABBO|nr:hypothetical protein [Babesia bovis]
MVHDQFESVMSSGRSRPKETHSLTEPFCPRSNSSRSLKLLGTLTCIICLSEY